MSAQLSQRLDGRWCELGRISAGLDARHAHLSVPTSGPMDQEHRLGKEAVTVGVLLFSFHEASIESEFGKATRPRTHPNVTRKIRLMKTNEQRHNRDGSGQATGGTARSVFDRKYKGM